VVIKDIGKRFQNQEDGLVAGVGVGVTVGSSATISRIEDIGLGGGAGGTAMPGLGVNFGSPVLPFAISPFAISPFAVSPFTASLLSSAFGGGPTGKSHGLGTNAAGIILQCNN
jgi:hypothetical protein